MPRVMMNRFILACLFLLLGGALSAPAWAGTLVARARLHIGTGTDHAATFKADVVERWVADRHQDGPPLPSDLIETHPGKDLIREVRIRCIKGCKRNVSYKEEVDDGIITIY